MCLAIFQSAGKQIPEGYLAEGFKNNPHGAGFMYFNEDGALKIAKFMDFEPFIDEYEKQWAIHGQHSPFGIHFRLATHGTTNIDNVHPFRMNENVGVLHNGILNCEIPDKKMSDTASFVKYYLNNLPRNWQDNEYLFDMVEQYCYGSKLVVMTNDPDAKYCAYIVNEEAGHWNSGVWYSNSSYSCARNKSKSMVTYKSAQVSAQTFEDYDIYKLDECQLCGEETVLDGLCYNCESCQQCWMTEGECKCASKSIHSLTPSQFDAYYNEDA